jgi:pyruvate dehydrogenase E2 component (dihydrolipoamide acetyltransferase)
VRKLARELGVDLGQVTGSGRNGRITPEDLRGWVHRALRAPTGVAGAGVAGAGVGGFDWPQMPDVDFAKFGPVEVRPLARIRKVSARNLHRSWLHVPHVTQHEDADVTEMEAFRKSHAEEAKAKGFKLTPLAFLLKAAAAALREFPQFNASLDPSGDNLILKQYVHIGVAVDTDDGLVVPVIRDVDQKGLYQLADEVVEASRKARAGKLLPRDFQGACFTISSLGGIGGTAFTPIVNAPEVAILGVSRTRMQPVWNGSEFVPRLMLPLSVSYDHRVIDGAMACRFTVHLASLLGDLRRLLL